MTKIYGYIRTSRRLQEGVPGMDPESQELQLRRAGVPWENLFRDIGVSGSTGPRSAAGGTAWMPAWPAATPWLSWPSTASDGPGRTPSVHLLAAGPWGEDSFSGRGGGPVNPLPRGR